MLTITIQGEERWDEENERFVYGEPIVLEFEHSLVSLSKWESKYHKLFLTPEKKTEEEMAGYIYALLVTPGYGPEVLDLLSQEHIHLLDAYINNPMTGTTIANLPQSKSKTSERISAELIYFWMSQYQIHISHEHWHLNRLFTLIKLHHAKSQKPQKMSRQKHVQTMAEVNAARKKKLGTSG